MSELLRQAFAVLGDDWTYQELDLVATTLRRSGDQEALALLEDDSRFEELAQLAIESGSGPLSALDLATTVAFGVKALTQGPHSGSGTRQS
jgi:hypothetical protein